MKKNEVTKDDEDLQSGVHLLRLSIGSVILIIGAVISLLILHSMNSLEGVGIMGIALLFTVLIGGNILAGSFDLSTAEVRRAISIAVVAVFFALLGKADTIKIQESLISPVLEKFWWIIITVVVFYFGGRTLEKLKKNI